MQRIITFDVNETLLDLRVLDPIFERVFGDATVRPIWFSQMLQIAFVGTITGRYVDFTTAQYAALRMLAARRGPELSDEDAEGDVGPIDHPAPYPDGHPASPKCQGG